MPSRRPAARPHSHDVLFSARFQRPETRDYDRDPLDDDGEALARYEAGQALRMHIAGEMLKAGRATSVYLMFDADDVLLYVGITYNPAARFVGHAHDKTWWPDVAYTVHEHYRNRTAARRREAFLIQTLHPAYNKSGGSLAVGKDDRLGQAILRLLKRQGSVPLLWQIPNDLPPRLRNIGAYGLLRESEGERAGTGSVVRLSVLSAEPVHVA